MTGTSGGRMLETLMRLMLPIPAARSALSKALRVVEPSACPAVAAAIVTVFVIVFSFLASHPWCAARAGAAQRNSFATLPRRHTNARKKLRARRSGALEIVAERCFF